MKTLSVFLLVAIVCFEHGSCFLTYPISKHVLGEFFKVLNATDKSYEEDLMKHAIAGEKCVRECNENERRICYFNFTLKHYQTLGG